MNQPFEMTATGQVVINGAEVLRSQMLVSAAAIALPEDFGKESAEKADLLERRLSRLEKELGLPQID